MSTEKAVASSQEATPPYTSAFAADRLRVISFVLAVLGVLVTLYLSYAKLANTQTVCIEGGAFNCDVVQNSVYSEVLGIPIAVLGLGAYLALAAILLLENRVALLREYGPALAFGITLFGFLYSGWLTYVEIFRLQALCIWCVVSALLMTLLFILASLRLRQMMLS